MWVPRARTRIRTRLQHGPALADKASKRLGPRHDLSLKLADFHVVLCVRVCRPVSETLLSIIYNCYQILTVKLNLNIQSSGFEDDIYLLVKFGQAALVIFIIFAIISILYIFFNCCMVVFNNRTAKAPG